MSRIGIKKNEGRCAKSVNRVRSRNDARKNEADDPSDISMGNVGPIGKWCICLEKKTYWYKNCENNCLCCPSAKRKQVGRIGKCCICLEQKNLLG